MHSDITDCNNMVEGYGGVVEPSEGQLEGYIDNNGIDDVALIGIAEDFVDEMTDDRDDRVDIHSSDDVVVFSDDDIDDPDLYESPNHGTATGDGSRLQNSAQGNKVDGGRQYAPNFYRTPLYMRIDETKAERR
ncbi:hypothetical protein M758_UG084600 [Ceratodon purpureus]|nr:hypothetical protein M758_UG084600 [Ceratodon purpureus]